MAPAPDLLLAQDFAQALHGELGDNLLRVSLFGSRARHNHRERSDYEFMIVLREPTGSSRSAVHLQALRWELDRGAAMFRTLRCRCEAGHERLLAQLRDLVRPPLRATGSAS